MPTTRVKEWTCTTIGSFGGKGTQFIDFQLSRLPNEHFKRMKCICRPIQFDIGRRLVLPVLLMFQAVVFSEIINAGNVMESNGRENIRTIGLLSL